MIANIAKEVYTEALLCYILYTVMGKRLYNLEVILNK